LFENVLKFANDKRDLEIGMTNLKEKLQRLLHQHKIQHEMLLEKVKKFDRL